MDDKTFTKAAKANFTLRLITGFILGIIATIVGIVFLIVVLVNHRNEFAPIVVMFMIAGPIVSASCGYFLFRKSKKKEDKKEAD